MNDGEFRYLYDFGDDGKHRIVIEESGLEDANPCPCLLDGAMGCPPEDIGGIHGYEALKTALMGHADEHGEMLIEETVGPDFTQRCSTKTQPQRRFCRFKPDFAAFRAL